MSVLILSNSAPNYHFFFNSLAKELSNLGKKVIYAVDSDYSRINNKVDEYSDAIHVFSDFFKNHAVSTEVLKKYKDCNLNYALLSDFERAEVYGIWRKPQYNNNYFVRLKSALLQFFEEIIDLYKPEMIIYENVSNTFSYFAYLVAVKKGVPYKGFSASRLPGRYEISEGPFEFDSLEETFKKIRSGEIVVPEDVQSSVREYIDGIESTEPDYMRTNKLSDVSILSRYIKKEKIIKLISLIKYSFGNSYYNFQIGNPLKTHLNLFLRNLRRSIKCRIIKNGYDEYDIDQPFFLYPLHFHPESSTSILAGNNLDEYEVIRSIAFNLPEGTSLYVKDHKSAWGYPSLKFYKKLKKLPNVRLIQPDAPTKVLIKNSIAVTTLTSTVGYEALLIGKPVLLFGRVFYEIHENVYRIKEKGDIHKVLRNFRSNSIRSFVEYNRQFVQAYWLCTHEGQLNLLNNAILNKNESKKFLSSILDSIIG